MNNPTQYFRIRNYEQYQSKKSDRNSLPWIKLHKKIMNDYAYSELLVSEKLMFIHMLLIADSIGNEFPLNAKWMRTKLQVHAKWNFSSFESKGLVEIIGHQEKCLSPPRLEEKRREENITSEKFSPTRRLSFSDQDLATANWMYELMKIPLPNIKPPNFESWANDIRLLRERDGKTDSEIRALFVWANKDEFWWKNILSPGKLRAKWDQLEAAKLGDRSAVAPSVSPDGLTKKFNQIKSFCFKNNGVEDWPHEIRQLLIEQKKFKSDTGGNALEPEEIEFLETSLSALEAM